MKTKLLIFLLSIFSISNTRSQENVFLIRDKVAANNTAPAINYFFKEMTPGIRVFGSPIQTPLNSFKTIKKNNYQLMLMDNFEISGLVLSKRNYIADERADIAPLDVVLGWGQMSDPKILKAIEIAQNNRFYYWHVNEHPIPHKTIAHNSTNLHLIPATKKIKTLMQHIKKGQILHLKGKLVDVKDKDGNLWPTSRSRQDEGDGACEILLVTQIRVTKE